jgi:hypothetical protein
MRCLGEFLYGKSGMVKEAALRDWEKPQTCEANTSQANIKTGFT